MGIAIGLILCAIAVYSLVTLAGVADSMRSADVVVTLVTQLLFLGVGVFLVQAYLRKKR